MTYRRLSMFFAALFALSACSPFTILNATIGEDGFTVHSGIRYGPDVRHALDVYVPKQLSGPLPVVVFFYGGSWRGGERADYLFAAEALTSRGYVAIVPDYRLFPDVRFPAFVEDGAKAVRWRNIVDAANPSHDQRRTRSTFGTLTPNHVSDVSAR